MNNEMIGSFFEEVSTEKTLPESYETPQLIQLSHAKNLPDNECLGGRGASCTWK